MSGKSLNLQVGHLHSFLLRGGNFCQMLTASNLNFWAAGTRKERKEKTIHNPCDSFDNTILNTLYITVLLCLIVFPQQFNWNVSEVEENTLRREIYKVVSVIVAKDEGGGWVQVRANLQSNKLGESTWEPFWDNGDLLAGRCAWQPGQTYTLGIPCILGIPGTAHSIPGVPGILYLVYYQAGTTPGLLVRPWFLVPHSGGVCDITFSRFLNKLWVSFHVIS